MPQTREHLDILDLLGVSCGVVALTKRDLVDDEWLELVREDVCAALAGTSLAGAELVACSATNREGLDELCAALDAALDAARPHPDRGRPHLPVDRVFTLAGFGTVVTGTLLEGTLQVGQDVEIAPRGLRARIRGLQAHKSKLDRAAPGGRVAVNLAGGAPQGGRRGAGGRPPPAPPPPRRRGGGGLGVPAWGCAAPRPGRPGPGVSWWTPSRRDTAASARACCGTWRFSPPVHPKTACWMRSAPGAFRARARLRRAPTCRPMMHGVPSTPWRRPAA